MLDKSPSPKDVSKEAGAPSPGKGEGGEGRGPQGGLGMVSDP